MGRTTRRAIAVGLLALGLGAALPIVAGGSSGSGQGSATAARQAAVPPLLFAFGSPGSGDGALNAPGAHAGPGGVAVDIDGNVWVADSGNNRIVKYDFNGTFIASFGSAEKAAYDDPTGVGADAAGNIYVADTGNSRVVKLTVSGAPEAVFGQSTNSAAPGYLESPKGVAADSAGNVYVVGANTITKFDSSGKPLGAFDEDKVHDPFGLAIDSAGNIYVADGANLRIDKFSPAGKFVQFIGDSGTGKFVGSADGVAVTPDDLIIGTDYGGADVKLFHTNGDFVDKIDYKTTENPIPAPVGVAADCRGSIYVVDYEQAVVMKFGDASAKPPPCTPPPNPTAGAIDAQINDIDVTQGIQPERTFLARRLPTGQLEVPTYGSVAYGPTVPLVDGRKTIVRVYASLRPGGPQGGIAGIPATLEAVQTVGGHSVQLGPIEPDAGPAVLKVSNNGYTVDTAERTDPAGAYTFTLPPEWSHGDVELIARIDPSGLGCDLDCRFRTTFTLDHVAFHRTTVAHVFPLALTINGAYPTEADGTVLTTPGAAFDVPSILSPVPFSVFPYMGAIEVGDIVSATSITTEKCFLGIKLGLTCSDSTAPADRAGLEAVLWSRIDDWMDDNNVPPTVIVAGLVSGARAELAGSTRGRLYEDPQAELYVNVGKPYNSVSHELQHALGRLHASGCGGGGSNGQRAEAWPPDEQGFIQGIGLDPRSGSGGARGPYRIIYPGANGGPPQWFDLMSYCAGPTDAWISVKGWNEVIHYHAPETFGTRIVGSRLRTGAPGPMLRVTAVLRHDGSLSIGGIEPATGIASRGPAGSPYIVETRDRSSKNVLASSEMTATVFGHGSAAATALTGEVPLSVGAAMVDVRVKGGQIVRLQRSAHAPTVKLTSPRAGQRAGGGKPLTVTWAANDADHDPLTATIDYSSDSGKTWRTVSIDRSKGTATFPSSALTPSTTARIRVRVDDGFSMSESISSTFTVAPAPPEVTISEPAERERIRADGSLYLSGQATAVASPVPGSSLHWFDGSRALGSGAALTVTGLAPGLHTIRLVVSAAGLSAAKSVDVVVLGAKPAFLRLQPPARLSRTARTLGLSIAATEASTLIVNGRRYSVGPTPRAISIAIKPGRSTLTVSLALKAGRYVTRAALQLRRT